MTDVNSKSTATPSTDAETNAIITAQSEPAAPIEESLAQKIVRLEAELEQARQGNLKRPIEQADGSTRGYLEVKDEHKAYLEEMALAHEQAVRFREDYERRNPVSYATPDGQLAWRPQTFTEKPLLDEDGAIKLFGLMKWANLSPKQKAQARTATKRDVDAVDLPSVFGRTSSARKAMELSSSNPALYRLCKIKAKNEDIF